MSDNSARHRGRAPGPSQTWLVTGGAGFIGSNFVRRALAVTSPRIVVLDKLTYAGNLQSLREIADDPRFSFVRGDIAERDTVDKVFAQHRPAAVFNFAAESHVDRSIDRPEAFVRTNIVGTFQLLEAARQQQSSTPVEGFRFVHVSTDEVYGSLGEHGAFREDTAYDPSSPYSASKAGADHLVQAYARSFGLPTLVTNCSNNYGPYQFPEKLLPLTLLNALEGRDLPLYGDGQQVRDWLFVEDHCDALLRVHVRGRPGERYNIGGGSERTNIVLVRAACRELERLRPAAGNPALVARGVSRYEDLIRFVPDRPGHDRRYAIDASRMRDELGWAPSHDFEAGLRRTVAWYLEHLDWCESVQSGAYRRERLGLPDAPEPH